MKNKLVYIVLFLFVLLSVFIILNFNGTGGVGDSVLHYLYAKYAPTHPELYFNHWAKPLFTLLSSPFAQFGFAGMKVFNSIASLFCIFFTFKIAEQLGLKNALLSAVFLIASPLFLLLTYSGLTEPLFALFVAAGTFYALKKQHVLAAIIISFLPFVRSEGLFFIGVLGLYLLLKKDWKTIPLLITGHLVYSIVGYFEYKDLLWVFTKIPYTDMNDNYGSGKLTHFASQLIFVLGVPVYILFWLGIVKLGWDSIKRKTKMETTILIGLGFMVFFVAHTLFWYLGKFNSMGLKRVFIGIAPLMAILALMGFNFITEQLLKNKKIPKLILQSAFLAYVFIFPFVSNPASPRWKERLALTGSQKCALKIADYFESHPVEKTRFIFIDPYLSEALKIDHFDSKIRVELNAGQLEALNTGELIVWENWFSIVERGITKQSLDNDPRLEFMFDSNVWDNRDIEYSVYKVR